MSAWHLALPGVAGDPSLPAWSCSGLDASDVPARSGGSEPCCGVPCRGGQTASRQPCSLRDEGLSFALRRRRGTERERPGAVLVAGLAPLLPPWRGCSQPTSPKHRCIRRVGQPAGHRVPATEPPPRRGPRLQRGSRPKVQLHVRRPFAVSTYVSFSIK